MKSTSRLFTITLAAALFAFSGAAWAQAGENGAPELVLNPYADVDWETFEHHKAALHTHTLQSDGHHPLQEVVQAYHDPGFTILAITDHDTHEPNEDTPYPEPEPDDYPANTTWPWPDFGAPAPEELGMVAIEGNELSDRHHMNSLYNDFGVLSRDKDEDEQLVEVRDRGGLAFLNHPGIDADWWTRQPLEWYVERFETHGLEYLAGIEVTNCSVETEKYDEGLWDQLLARFMPDRPIWGFGTDDMHSLASVRESHSVFVIDELTDESVRAAMEDGQFYFRKSSRRNDFREREPAEELFPLIHAIDVDEDAGVITVDASNYDVIQWITAPESLEPVADYETSNEPWPLGQVVHEGATLNYRETPELDRYVRIELHREDGEESYRTFTNPFGFASSE
ncbi:MAG: hypothetical protein R6W89_10985 [Candidatus Hydrogenedentota bacterium]